MKPFVELVRFIYPDFLNTQFWDWHLLACMVVIFNFWGILMLFSIMGLPINIMKSISILFPPVHQYLVVCFCFYICLSDKISSNMAIRMSRFGHAPFFFWEKYFQIILRNPLISLISLFPLFIYLNPLWILNKSSLSDSFSIFSLIQQAVFLCY